MCSNSLLQRNQSFFIVLFPILFLGIYPLIAFDNVTLFLHVNSWHHPWLDAFFFFITFLGGTASYVLLLVVLLALRSDMRTLLAGVGSFTAMSIIVQVMKKLLFADQLRPIMLIPTDTPLYLVEGAIPQTHFSFPSGHAGTIFTAICIIHIFTNKKSVWLSLFLCLLAVAVAYSRIYLCQHFYRDVYVGAWIGTYTTVLVSSVLMNWEGPDWLTKDPFTLLYAQRKRCL